MQRAAYENMLTQSWCAVFGGRGITVGGMGVLIEQFNRTFKFDSVSHRLVLSLAHTSVSVR